MKHCISNIYSNNKKPTDSWQFDKTVASQPCFGLSYVINQVQIVSQQSI